LNLNAKGKRAGVFLVGSLLLIGWMLIPVVAKAFLYRAANVFHAPAESFASKVGRVQDYWALRLMPKNDLIIQHRMLSRDHAQLLLDQQQYDAQAHYVDRLERLLGLNPVSGFTLVNARVIRRDMNSWLQELRIDRGSDDRVAPGMAVIASGGLIGRVKDVEAHASTVTLVTSPAFRITVNTASDDRPIAYQGRGQSIFSPLKGAASHIPHDLAIRESEEVDVYTTGLGDGLPAGIWVGSIDSLESEVEGLFSKGLVRLNEQLRYVKEVAVLIPSKQGD
jgi:cell shape-determining protein MreC